MNPINPKNKEPQPTTQQQVPTNTSQTTPVNNPPTEKPEKYMPTQPKGSGFLVTLLSVLLLIAVGSAGFFAYQTQNLVKQLNEIAVQPTSTPTASVEPQSTPDPTADWKTYTNAEYNFQIKYPADAKLRVNQPESDDRMMTVAFDSPNATFDHLFKSGGYSFEISMQTQENFNTIDEYLLFQKEHNMYEEVLAKTYNNVNGYTFKKDKGYSGLDFIYRGYIAKNNDLFYTINYFTDDSADMFNQILSTFEFVEN